MRLEEVAERLVSVRDRIGAAGGDRDRVGVVAVTKGLGLEAVTAAVEAGLDDLGENYAQELLSKVIGSPASVRWHYLGELQRNKLARLAPHVHLWQGLDSAPRAAALAQRCPAASVMVEVQLLDIPGRQGVPPSDVPALVEGARAAGLNVRGLMAVGPAGVGPAESRRCFKQVANLAKALELEELSMGMSDDFEAAVAEGSTMVRLGRALFGERRVMPPARPPG